MDEEQQEDTTECVENKLRELRDQIKRMEKENSALFEELGLSPHQVSDTLSDTSQYSKTAYEYIQRERQALEAILDRRIEEVNAPLKIDSDSDNNQIGGHWIFVR